MKAIAFALAATILAACQAQADPDRVSILLGSHHVGASGFEETNPGVFMTWDASPFDWTAGLYRNSYGRTSVAAMASYPVAEWKRGELAVFAGLAHYPGDGRRMVHHLGGDVIPMAGVQVRHGNLFAQVIPSDGKPVKAILAFGVTFDLNSRQGP